MGVERHCFLSLEGRKGGEVGDFHCSNFVAFLQNRKCALPKPRFCEMFPPAAMSEFKFACPVCGQHMKCDVSDAGSVMECPTCFQKIVAPQAPTADSKFILAGTKLSEKVVSVRGYDPATTAGAPPEKDFPIKNFIIVLAVCLVAGALLFIIHINKKPVQPIAPPPLPPPKMVVPPKVTVPTNVAVPPKPVVVTNAAPKPPAVAPRASDKYWTLALDSEKTPGATVVGRIHGLDFMVEKGTYQNGELILRAGTNGPVEFGARINFGVLPDALTNKTVNVSTSVDKAAVAVLLWKENGVAQKEIFKAGYALRLEDGAIAKNIFTGKIYLCTPDAEKSYLMGKFYAYIVKPKPPAQPAPTQPSPPKKK